MEVSAEQVKSLRQLLALVSPQPGVPSSTFIGLRIQKKEVLFSLSSMVSVQAKIASDLPDGFWAIDRRILLPFLESTDAAVVLSIKDETLHVQSGRRKANLKLVQPNWTYNSIDLTKFKRFPITEALHEMLTQVRVCASDDPVLPEVNCVHIEFGKREYFFSTNDLILCMAVGVSKPIAENISWSVPIHLIDAVAQLSANEILVNGRVMAVSTEAGTVWGAAPEKSWDSFPKKRIKDLIVKMRKAPLLFSVKASVLSEVCQRFQRYLSYIPKNEWVLKVETLSDTKAKVTSTSSYATFTEGLIIESNAMGSTELNLALVGPVLTMLTNSDVDVLVSQVQDHLCFISIGAYQFLISQRV